MFYFRVLGLETRFNAGFCHLSSCQEINFLMPLSFHLSNRWHQLFCWWSYGQAFSVDFSGLQQLARFGVGQQRSQQMLSSQLLLQRSRTIGGITSMSQNRRQQSKEYSEEHILKFLGDSTFHRTCWDRTRKILMPDCHCDYFFPLGWCVLENCFHSSKSGREGTEKTPNNRNEQVSGKYSAQASIMVSIQ